METRRCAALTVLARAEAEAVKALAEEVLPGLGQIDVLKSRTGLVMLPCRETAQGAVFHLGEVLVAEAHIHLTAWGVEGYGACVGRDLEHAMAMAVLDAAMVSGVSAVRIAAFVDRQARHLSDQDQAETRRVATTRVAMETY